MNIDANDPRLTAYALDELDARERAEIEALLAASPEAAAAVEDIRRAAALLTRELADGDHERLTPAQHRRIESAAAPRILRWPRYAAAASIVLLVGAVGLSLSLPSLHRAREIYPANGHTFATVESEAPAAPMEARAPHEPQAPISPLTTPTPARETWVVIPPSTSIAAPRAQPTSPVVGTSSTPSRTTSPLALTESGEPSTQVRVSNDVVGDIALWFDSRDQSMAGKGRNVTMSVSSADSTTDPSAGRPPYKDAWYEYRLAEEATPLAPRCGPPLNTESYSPLTDNPFFAVKDSPLSTFSIDVDTASFANVRRFLTAGQLPPKDAVRIEELLNYFSYDYPPPTGDQPFSVNIETAQCPWKPEHRLVRVGLRGRTFDERERPACNLVFLIDVSGSMQPANKLPLLKQALALLVPKLGEKDRVAIVVYAGSSGLVLPSTTANNQATILSALDKLEAGGSTNGGAGIELAYKTAGENLIPGGVNRVILCTDGDFNVGVTSQGDLVRLVEEKARGGVFLSVLGFGMDNLKDSTLEQLADKGNGNYAYIDTPAEARKVLVEQMGGTLVTIAKDVKIQIEFNPAVANAYRLIGYENRVLAAQDFNDDKKDAGEIGAGHTVTALYEVVPVGMAMNLPSVDPLKYQPQHVAQPPSAVETRPAGSNELLTLKLRYKQPNGDTSRLIEQAVTDSGAAFASASPDFRFAAAVAAFGMTLRDSPHKAMCNLSMAEELAMGALGEDRSAYRSEFLGLVRRARTIPPAR